MTAERSTSLADGAKSLGVALDAAQTARLDAYLDAVLDVNRTLNLTSVRDRGDAVVRHLLDSLSIVPAWHALAGAAPPRRVLDLGTGGGFPGAVLAVAWPESRVLLIDGTGKKARAVAGCLGRAGVTNAEALQARGTDLPKTRPAARASFDLCVARAVGPAAELVRELAPLVAAGGRIVLMKGPNTAADEIAGGEREARRCGLVAESARTADVPGLERRLLLSYAKRTWPIAPVDS
jgi:16S rRNA (guanine527-N7)-methyltransferase